MKILLAWPYFYPDANAASVRGEAFARYMKEDNVEIDVISPATSEQKTGSDFHGCRIHRVVTYSTMASIHPLIGMLYFPLGVYRLVRKIKKMNTNTIISSSPHILFPFEIFFAAKILGIPHIFDVRDTSLMEEYTHPGKGRNKMKIKIEKIICNGSYLIFIVTPWLKKSIIEQHGIAPTRVKVVYNGIDPNLLHSSTSEQKSIDLIHVGAPRLYYDTLRFFREVLKDLVREIPDIKIVYIGADSNEQYTKKVIGYARKHNLLKNLEFLPEMAHSEINSWISKSRIGLHTSTSNTIYKPGLGVKMMEYLAAGIPIVSYGQTGTEQAEFIEKNDIGISTADSKVFISTVKELLLDDKARDDRGKRGRKAIEQFDRKKIIREAYKEYIEPVGKDSSVK
jgi:glycosyltransferase involved in cell wall biosynthesis